MARILGIDYGAKRVGLAATDPLQIIANALTTVRKIDLFDYLSDYFEKEEVEAIVVGEPKQRDGSASEIESEIKGFVRNFKKKYPNIEVIRHDERFTSSMAQQSLIDSGLKKKDRQKKELVDQVAADIILNSYLQSR